MGETGQTARAGEQPETSSSRSIEVEPDAPRPPEDMTQVDMRSPSEALVAAGVDAASPGTRIGRYMIVEVVGSGGVGMVYAAYDPALDRKVALKQLRRSKTIGQTEAVNQRRGRLRREAQALARLSHPNVVPVYEVATFDDQIYVVMEFVEGLTLSGWLAAEPRTWSEVVGMYVQAGRGLAAAHAADIVHRDFKPDNVRVGTDGRVRVLDFGLASPLREAEDAEGVRARLQELVDQSERSLDEDSWTDSAEGSGDGGSGSGLVTREGQVMGTPAYMPPEQASGGHVDARSDQFSFCVALYEAIYGTRPFRGRFDNPRRFRDLSRARTLPGNRPEDLPVEIERVLIRGLSLVPDRRFESMDALLAELTGVATGPRRLWWVPMLIMLLAIVSVVAFYERRAGPKPVCDDGMGMLEGVWDEAANERLGAAVVRSNKPYARATWDSVAARFDDWVQQWSRARQRACEATHLQGDQSLALLERRIACLDLQLVRVESMVAVLRRLEDRPDELLERLTPLELPSVESCAAANVLERSPLEPNQAEIAAQASSIREALAGVEGLTNAGEYAQAIAQAEQVLAQARALDFDPVTAEALLALGLAVDRQRAQEQRGEDLLREAAWTAQRSGHDSVLIRAAAALADTLGSDQAKLELANTWGSLARATFVKHGEDPGIEAEVREHLGKLAMAAGDYDLALAEYMRGLELARHRDGEHSPAHIAALLSIGNAQHELGRYVEAAATLGRARELAATSLGAKHPSVPAILDALGNVESSQSHFDRALELHREALRINEEIYGADHRRVAKNLNNLAIIYDETGRYAESLETLERARGILVTQLGAAHPDVAFVDVNIGSALQNLGRNEEALAGYESARVVLESSLGGDHMAVGVTLQNLASVRAALGDDVGALADFDRAQAVLERAFSEDHPTIAAVEVGRARSLRSLNRYDEALAGDQRALAMREKIFGPEHTELVEPLTGLCETQLALGDPAQARETGERALTIAGEANTANELAQARMAMAKVLMLGGRQDRVRAEALARAALAELKKGRVGTRAQARVEAWLVANGFAML
ncbi:High-affnity carbon uptake protein Hat/HatR [Enhygromyxa salina]|uniref:High-affnity carbon uptake protein Hat/HatR n=1 Tax=Enhygromyxa salina TaxID=215803 RepID=A0A0C1ZXU0_9BACT|nr:serine/threonine-protein kinase [Enhygromyxa salina]KIG16053.1 High-affnity carbon uptake protein Hat/HatR [Enhygromyxa salina]